MTPTNPVTRETPTIALPAAPTHLAATEDAVWVLTPANNSLVRVDPATGRVAARVLLPRTSRQRPHQVAVGEGAVWVTSAGTRAGTVNLLWRVNPASNQVTGTLDLGPTSAGGMPNRVAVGQPDWLVVSLGVLSATLALVAGLAVLAARRATRRLRTGHAA